MSTRRQRRKFTAEFKSNVAIEAKRGELTLADISQISRKALADLAMNHPAVFEASVAKVK